MPSLVVLYIVEILTAICITQYFFWLKRRNKGDIVNHDVLNKAIIYTDTKAFGNLSWWPISHIVFNAILTVIWPEHVAHIFSLGVLWEIFEYYTNKAHSDGKTLKFKSVRDKNNNIQYEKWWSSSSKDILFNILGILFGLSVHQL